MMESKVSGEDDIEYDFDSLGISSSLQLVLQREGVIKPSRHQYCAIKSLMNNESIVLQSKSGTGKTMSFCIAIAQMIMDIYNDETLVEDAYSVDILKNEQVSTPYLNAGVDRANTSDDLYSLDGVSVEGSSGTLTPSETPGSETIIEEQDENLIEACSLGKSVTDLRDIALGNVVVVAPTRELATQIHDMVLRFLEPVQSDAVSLNIGGNDWKVDINHMVKIAPKVIVATPGRLRTLFKQIKKSSTLLTGDMKIYWNTQMLILDEVDMLLDEQFLEQTRHICSKLVNPFVQVVAVSATFQKFQFKIYEDMISYIDTQFKGLCLMSLHENVEESFHMLKGSFSIHVAKCVRNLLMKANSVNLQKDCDSDDVSGKSSTYDNDNNNNGALLEDGNLEQGEGVTDNDESDIRTPYNDMDKSLPTKYISLVRYLDEYVRHIRRIIVSSSYVNRVALTSKDIICFTENDTIQGVQDMKQAICEGGRNMVEMYDTPVLKNITFYFVKVPEAPNIVKQISIRLKNVIMFLRQVEYRKCVIFCNQSHTRILTTSTLQKMGFTCDLVSSRLSCESRKKNVESMIQMDRNILIAADVISRGVHIENVDLVINMDLPSSKEAFLHRSGRTGRYGKKGLCISICTEPEMETLRYLEYALNFKCQLVADMFNNVALENGGMSTKREYLPDSSETTSLTDYNITANERIKNLSTDAYEYHQPDDSGLGNGSMGLGYTWTQDKFTTGGHAKLIQEDNFDLIVRETLISSIQNRLFPVRKQHILHALGVISCHGFDVVGKKSPDNNNNNKASDKSASNIPKEELCMQIRFTEILHSKVVVHMSKSLHDYIKSLDVKSEINKDMYHILVEQETIDCISIFSKQNNMFCSTQTTLLLTVEGDIQTVESLREISAMKNVEFVVSEKLTMELQSIGSSNVVKQLTAVRGKQVA